MLERPATTDEMQSKQQALSRSVAIEGLYDVAPEESHFIIHQNGDRATFRELGRQYATEYTQELFMKEAQSRGAQGRLLKRLASPLNTRSTLRGQIFEATAHLAVRNGGSFEYKFVDVPCSVPATGKRGAPSGPRLTALQAALDQATAEAATIVGTVPGKVLRLTVPKLELKVFTAGKKKAIGDFQNAAKLCASPSYLQPDDRGHPVIDACVYPDTLLNFNAASRVASVDENVLEEHLQCLPDLERYYLDYMVPADVYPTFTPAPLRHNHTHTRVARTHMRVVKSSPSCSCGPLCAQRCSCAWCVLFVVHASCDLAASPWL